MQVKAPHISCAGQHKSIIIIIIAIKVIDIDTRAAPVAEQTHLVCHLLLCKEHICLINRHGLFDDTIIFIYVFLHLCLNLCNKRICHLKVALLGTIITIADRKFHLDLFNLVSSDYIINRFHENHRRCTVVRFMSCIVRQREEFHSAVLIYFFEQLLDLSISDCQRNRIWILLLIYTGNLTKGNSRWIRPAFFIHCHLKTLNFTVIYPHRLLPFPISDLFYTTAKGSLISAV